LYFLAYY
ncbi:hypothetical protein EAG_07880, partial [Camponotus floridanus]